MCHNSRFHKLQPLSQGAATTETHTGRAQATHNRDHRDENPPHHNREYPHSPQWEKASA